MPCNSDHMQQTSREAFFQRTARLYAYFLKGIGKTVPGEVSRAADDYYCRDNFVPVLCMWLRETKNNDPAAFDRIVYNAKDRLSRDLANWWEDHEKADGR